MNSQEPGRRPYVSRGGQKLEAALRAFGLDVAGLVCADLGSHVGGFVDCLLRRGAARVYAVEPGYGVLDYRLRRDPRVVVCERTNALEFRCPEPCDLATIDVGWTPQRLIVAAAERMLRPGGQVITLIKPQYEAPREWVRGGVLATEHVDEVLRMCRGDLEELGWTVRSQIRSPIPGRGGNVEHFWLLSPPPRRRGPG